jgi:hypothetical protein
MIVGGVAAAALVAFLVYHFDLLAPVEPPESSDIQAQVASTNPVEQEAAEQLKQPPVVVYYFHGEDRSRTCLNMEDYTRQALQTGFAKELESGQLSFEVINIENPENMVYAEMFNTGPRSIIITKVIDEQPVDSKKLGKIWNLIRSKRSFIKYITLETQPYLETQPEIPTQTPAN